VCVCSTGNTAPGSCRRGFHLMIGQRNEWFDILCTDNVSYTH